MKDVSDRHFVYDYVRAPAVYFLLSPFSYGDKLLDYRANFP